MWTAIRTRQISAAAVSSPGDDVRADGHRRVDVVAKGLDGAHAEQIGHALGGQLLESRDDERRRQRGAGHQALELQGQRSRLARPARGTERVDSPFQLIDGEPDGPEREGRPRQPAAVAEHRLAVFEVRGRCHAADGENRELAVQEPHREHGPEGDRPVPQCPQREHVQERFDARSKRFEQVGRQDRRGCGQRQDRGQRQPWRADRPREAAQQPHRDDAVDDHERQPQHGHGRSANPDERRRDPGLDAEHVVLSVEEERKRAELAEVLRHEADDGLVRIEVEVLVGEKRKRPKDDDGDRQEAAPEQGGRPLVHEGGVIVSSRARGGAV